MLQALHDAVSCLNLPHGNSAFANGCDDKLYLSIFTANGEQPLDALTHPFAMREDHADGVTRMYHVTPIVVPEVPTGELRRWECVRNRILTHRGCVVVEEDAILLKGTTGFLDTDGVIAVVGEYHQAFVNRQVGVGGTVLCHWTQAGYPNSLTAYNDVGRTAKLCIVAGRVTDNVLDLSVFCVPIANDPEVHNAIFHTLLLCEGRKALHGT